LADLRGQIIITLARELKHDVSDFPQAVKELEHVVKVSLREHARILDQFAVESDSPRPRLHIGALEGREDLINYIRKYFHAKAEYDITAAESQKNILSILQSNHQIEAVMFETLSSLAQVSEKKLEMLMCLIPVSSGFANIDAERSDVEMALNMAELRGDNREAEKCKAELKSLNITPSDFGIPDTMDSANLFSDELKNFTSLQKSISGVIETIQTMIDRRMIQKVENKK
jgi:hypothetical protein